jgi:hypothetical protein
MTLARCKKEGPYSKTRTNILQKKILTVRNKQIHKMLSSTMLRLNEYGGNCLVYVFWNSFEFAKFNPHQFYDLINLTDNCLVYVF